MERVKFISEMREAIKNDNLKRVQDLLQEDKEKLNLVLPTGSWLNLAITHKANDIIIYLVTQGIDKEILIASTKGNALSTAAAVGNTEILQYLLDSGFELKCECNDSNPIFSAVRGNNILALNFLMELERERLGSEEYEQLINKIIEEAKMISNESILNMLGMENNKNDISSEVLIDKNKLMDFLLQGVKEAVTEALKLYTDSYIYIMSLEIDVNDFSCYLYVNTKENLETKLQESNGEDRWYYYFCEDEWDVIEDSPKYFVRATEYMQEIGIKREQIMEIYDIAAEAVAVMRQENFFQYAYQNKIIFAFKAYEEGSQEEIIALFKKVNEEKDCADFIDNIDDFF